MVDEVRLIPNGDVLQIEVYGGLTAIIALGTGAANRDGCGDRI